jgi:hypothetical protein
MRNLLGKNIRTQKKWRKKKMTINLIGSRKKIIPEQIIDKFILGYHSLHQDSFFIKIIANHMFLKTHIMIKNTLRPQSAVIALLMRPSNEN